MLYFYTIAGAKDFIISKLIFNLLLMLCMSIISLLLFLLLLGNSLQNVFMFVGITSLGGISLSLVFTFLAAIAAKAQQAALMAIMGFPIIIPQLLLLMKISTPAFATVVQQGWWQMVLLLVALDIMVVMLSIILFPFMERLSPFYI
jgi:heme exporter protein B